MTELEIARLRAKRVAEIDDRLESCSKGPWRVAGKYTVHAPKTNPYNQKAIARTRANQTYRSEEEDAGNAAFIAHARQDIEWLLGYIEELEDDKKRVD